MHKMLRHLVILALITIGLCSVFYSVHKDTAPKAIKYSDYLQLLDSDSVAEVVIEGSGTRLTGSYKNPEKGKPAKFYTHFRPEMRPSPEQEARDRGVPLTVKEADSNLWWNQLIQIVPLLLIMVVFLVLIMRQAQSSGGQAFSFGRSRHKLVSDHRVKVTFDDVEGVTEAKQELSEVVDYLKFPKKYQKVGARIPKGVLLVGAPGTGKTLLGRAVAGEAGVPFYYISGSDFVEMFVGVGASRVRDLFEQAKKTSPCIVFVDEIDAVGRQRGTGLGGGHDEREQTLNQLLVEMDGFDATQNVIVIAATNRPDVLDPALLRPGRFDRRVIVDKPDIAGRISILKVHSKGKPLDPEVDVKKLARRTPGFSGADLENLLNEAALQAARSGRDTINQNDCEEAIDRVMMGPERKSRIIPEREREVTAYHEAGHALVARAIPEADPVRKVTILPRGMTLGVTSMIPEEDRYNHTREEMIANIAVLMGGRAAEELVFNEVTTGASNDIERATQTARDMVTRYGMSKVLGPVNFAGSRSNLFLGREMGEQRDFSEAFSRQIDEEVMALVKSQYERAYKILEGQRAKLDEFASELIAAEVLEDVDLDRILGPASRKPEREARELDREQKIAARDAKPAADDKRDEAARAPGGLSPNPA
jgi:cell division protease FtsH